MKTGQPRVLVSVDGTPSKRTDEHGLTTLELPAGTHSVRIAKQGFETPDEQKIAIAANDSQTLAFDLIPQTIASQPKTGGGAITTTPPPTSAPTPPAAPSPEELEAQAWQVAHSAGDPAQLANFLAKYPNGAHVTEARIQLDDADWSRVNTSDMQSLKTYISQHSTGRHAREASSRIAYLDYMNLDKSDESALRAYLNEHPDSPYYAQVQSLISAIEAGKSAARSPQPSDTGPKSSGVQPETFGITSALTLFNSAFKRKQPKDVKKIWPSVPDEYIESMRQPGATYLMQLTPNPNAAPEINGDTASIRCDLSITIKRAGKSQETSRPVKVRLQKVSGSWSIVDVLGT